MIQKTKSGRRPEELESPPTNTVLGYQACTPGVAWVASAILRRF
ncbi:hypothetical protein K60_037970 [Mycobacterium tuberculosis variant bovis BCG str. Korea 1168P]|uniref:Uncharacterized protein n=1 Tax=Mycobacterium tuberculosis (strain CDC 1551 / Oshkosh) TaxID=83331 RepID=Q8VIW1_MYCTO|nr:hypothetical protein MT3762 [Mycobacterium tuberculosis CDC1551]AGE69707.1 hypothetical protein K60_037970 [Mycobacterium tuberculosis variant bovis BCG str. Korea 1168P]AGM02312.1 hypothetical protein CFBS_3880 [Mycobacterium tuberculosis CCDC5079]AHJ44522.1 hypothetical protein HKBS1_3877 [Mycobacterium tuberculosis HKBS1]AHJ48669.1 hypothetical protein HKBT2_3873 [Mycobacterium tuberculosis BT2]AHJ52810.1 hypothetical protein HKBT1_3864 [Mycobacterium tuberculosis BT1]AHJ56969.1 hypothe